MQDGYDRQMHLLSKQPGRITMLVILISTLVQSYALAQVIDVWVLGDGEKVYREEQFHPDRSGNEIYYNDTIHLRGLYNEVLAFQVIAETTLSGARGLEVSMEFPVNKESGRVIGANTLKYGPDGTIEIFSEHYLHVKKPTQPNWYYGSHKAAPEKMTGWIPDALIPSDAMRGKGGFPVDVTALDTIGLSQKNIQKQNQGFWIDISLPRDQQKFPAGKYYGEVSLFEQGKLKKEIPLEIILLPDYMPDENHTNVWLFTENVYPYFPQLKNSQVDELLKFEGHRHRIDVAGGFEANAQSFDTSVMHAYLPYLNGEAFTPANNYLGSGEGIGEHVFPIGMYGSHIMGDNKNEVQHQSTRWVNWFNKNAPQVKYFWYLIDEPAEDKYPWIRERADWIKSNKDAGRELPLFTTRQYQKPLLGAIDIWAGYDGVNLHDLALVRKNGGDHFFYNGNRPRYGSVILEAAAVDFRVNSWIMYKYGINTWFLWNGTHWQHNGQGPKRHSHQNVFLNPLTFINDEMDFGNGDGIVFYPGHMPFYPDEDRGINRLIPSIRLKNIRRGQQDAEIMFLAEKKAGREKVMSLIQKVVPKALSEVDMKDVVYWSQRGNDYDKIRGEIFKLLE